MKKPDQIRQMQIGCFKSDFKRQTHVWKMQAKNILHLLISYGMPSIFISDELDFTLMKLTCLCTQFNNFFCFAESHITFLSLNIRSISEWNAMERYFTQFSHDLEMDFHFKSRIEMQRIDWNPNCLMELSTKVPRICHQNCVPPFNLWAIVLLSTLWSPFQPQLTSRHYTKWRDLYVFRIHFNWLILAQDEIFNLDHSGFCTSWVRVRKWQS